MNDKPNFQNMTDSDDFSLVNHNPADFDSFHKFQEIIDARFAKIEEKRSKAERLKNIQKWDSMQTKRWKGARLKTINNPAADEAEKLIKENQFGSFFIQGANGVGKTYLGYAILRRYIGLGWITPSQIKIISEESLLRIPQLGFAGRERFEELLSKDYKVYLFDSVGQRSSYDSKRDIPLWEQMIDHVYSQSLAAIFTSTSSAESFSLQLPGSASSKFRHLIEGKEITMIGDGSEPKLKGLTEDENNVNNKIVDEIDKMNLFRE